MAISRIHTPEGVRDIYGKEILRKLQIQKQLHEKLYLYGFQDIQTPTFEFLDIFSDEVGTTPEKELYRFFDKEGNTLALRPDFTPSIARCAAKYYMEKAVPVRLCYEGNTFSNQSELQGKLKETTQMGAELIGDASVDADGEMICLVIEALKACGFKEFQVSIGEIDYFKGICEEACLDEETVEELRSYISSKNYFGAEEMLCRKEVPKRYNELLLNANEITSVDELITRKEMVDNEKSLAAIERLVEIYRVVECYGLEKYVSFDLGMLSKFHYYTGLIFKAYTYGVGDAIVKGGRYDNLLGKFGKESPAVGFVFLVDDILNALSAQKILKDKEECLEWVVYLPGRRKEALKYIRERRENGKTLVGMLFDSSKTMQEYVTMAKENGVTYGSFFLEETKQGQIDKL